MYESMGNCITLPVISFLTEMLYTLIESTGHCCATITLTNKKLKGSGEYPVTGLQH